MVGAPHFLSSTTLRPFGPRVTRTASASWFMPASRPRRACSSNAIVFAMWFPPLGDRYLAELFSCVSRISTLRRRVLIGYPRPVHAIVTGAGVAGLGTALTLSRAGHRVTLLERDATHPPR